MKEFETEQQLARKKARNFCYKIELPILLTSKVHAITFKSFKLRKYILRNLITRLPPSVVENFGNVKICQLETFSLNERREKPFRH